jgi:transcription initiation factor TFIID subunit TAF12
MQASAAISPAVQPYMAPLVGQRIQDLVTGLDPSYTIDAQAQEQVLQLADDFLDKVCKQSLRIAAHRGSSVLEVQDVQLVLAKQWGIVIPGLGPPMLNKSRIMPASSKSHHSGNSSSHSAGGTKRKATGSNKNSVANASQQQSQPKTSKPNESVPMDVNI